MRRFYIKTGVHSIKLNLITLQIFKLDPKFVG